MAVVATLFVSIQVKRNEKQKLSMWLNSRELAYHALGSCFPFPAQEKEKEKTKPTSTVPRVTVKMLKGHCSQWLLNWIV